METEVSILGQLVNSFGVFGLLAYIAYRDIVLPRRAGNGDHGKSDKPNAGNGTGNGTVSAVNQAVVIERLGQMNESLKEIVTGQKEVVEEIRKARHGINGDLQKIVAHHETKFDRAIEAIRLQETKVLDAIREIRS